MNSQGIKKKLPDAPGVYFFKKGKDILYIGRATSLRDRVRSYFRNDLVQTRSLWIVKMLEETNGIEAQKTDSVLEAILLEAELIKKFKPPYNTELKDDKSLNCVVITREDFPRVLVVRKHELDSSIIPARLPQAGRHNSRFTIHSLYGPFTRGTDLRIALKIIRRIFPFRDKCTPSPIPPFLKEVASPRAGGFNSPDNATGGRLNPSSEDAVLPLTKRESRGRRSACFNRQIGLCPGVCTGEISRQEYAKIIRHIRLFFEGKKKRLLGELRREMKVFAKGQRFEKANEVKKTIFAIQHIQDIALMRTTNYSLITTNFRIEAYDIAHLGGMNAVGVMVAVENGEARKSEYRMFKIKTAKGGDDVGALREVLYRRLKHGEWRMPNLIVVDGGVAQRRAAETEIRKALSAGDLIPVVSVVKDEHHRPRAIEGGHELVIKYKKEILLANSEAHRFAIQFHRKRQSFVL